MKAGTLVKEALAIASLDIVWSSEKNLLKIAKQNPRPACMKYGHLNSILICGLSRVFPQSSMYIFIGLCL